MEVGATTSVLRRIAPQSTVQYDHERQSSIREETKDYSVDECTNSIRFMNGDSGDSLTIRLTNMRFDFGTTASTTQRLERRFVVEAMMYANIKTYIYTREQYMLDNKRA